LGVYAIDFIGNKSVMPKTGIFHREACLERSRSIQTVCTVRQADLQYPTGMIAVSLMTTLRIYTFFALASHKQQFCHCLYILSHMPRLAAHQWLLTMYTFFQVTFHYHPPCVQETPTWTMFWLFIHCLLLLTLLAFIVLPFWRDDKTARDMLPKSWASVG